MYEDFGGLSSLLRWGLPLAVCLPDPELTPSLCHFPSVLGERKLVTVARCGLCCWNWFGSHVVVNGAQQGRLGLVMVCEFLEDCSGMSCPAALVLSHLIAGP